MQYPIWYGGGVVGLLFLSQLRIESLAYQFKQGILNFLVDPSISGQDVYIISNFVSPIRGIILWVSLVAVTFPIIQNMYTILSGRTLKIPLSILFQSAFLFAVLCVMFKTFWISGLSEEYSNTSIVIFSKLSTVSVHQRLLMPVLAHLLFFRGDTFYLILFDLKGFVQFLSIAGVYILFTLTINLNISEIWAARDVGGTSSLAWLFTNPDREFLGIFYGFKALWLIVLGTIVYLHLNKRYIEIFQILMIIGTGIAMTALGVDTSRLFGWAFMAVLFSWKILFQAGGRWKTMLNVALLVNLLVPSMNVHLVMKPYITPGLHSIIIGFIFR